MPTARHVPQYTVSSALTTQPSTVKIPVFSSRVSAGFPSPAEEAVDVGIDLNKLLIAHPAATFLVRATGESMIEAGIFDDDLLVVDRSLQAQPGDIVIAYCDDQFLVKRLTKLKSGLHLVAENKKFTFRPILVDENVVIWGVVRSVIKLYKQKIGETELR